MSHNVNSRAMKTKNPSPDYYELYIEAKRIAENNYKAYAQTMQWLNETTKKQIQLEDYVHALEMDALNAYLNKSKYFEQTTTTKFC
nr:MAG TPA: hypothetical protein [Caudoviricetes sp.]